MDPNRFREAYQRLRLLDEQMTYKVRPRSHALTSPGIDQIDTRLKDLARYTTELREIIEELFLALGSRPATPGDP